MNLILLKSYLDICLPYMSNVCVAINMLLKLIDFFCIILSIICSNFLKTHLILLYEASFLTSIKNCFDNSIIYHLCKYIFQYY